MPEILNVDWPTSKDVISRFAQDSLNTQYERDSEFWEPYTQGKGCPNVEELLLKLGHEDKAQIHFPRIIRIEVPRFQNLGGHRVSDVLLPEFYDQITDEVERHVIKYRIGNSGSGAFIPTSQAFQNEIDVLRALSTVSYDRWIKVAYESYMGGFEHTVGRISAPDL